MGATGPCGPCSEIHFDRIGGRNAAHLVNEDDPNVLEIWNNVFIQFNRETSGDLRPLPNKHVDTGMGFERLVSVLQNHPSNYDTDVFTPIFAKIQELTGARAYAGKLGDEDKDGVDTAYRVVADHIRTLTIAISDGGMPDKDGRGYVLRRILRRGVRYANNKLGVKMGSFFSSLIPVTVDTLSPIFPEVTKKVKDLKEILDEEEASFARTLARGEALFSKYAAQAEEEKRTTLAGKDVWRLYDTYGFPVDLTQIMAEERGLKIDDAAFEKARLESLEASKGGGKNKDAAGVKLDVHDIGALEQNDAIPKTDDQFKFGKFRDHNHLMSLLIKQEPRRSRRPSRVFTNLPNSCHRLLSYLPMLHSVFYSTRPTSTPSRVVKRMILVFSLLTARPNSRLKMSKSSMVTFYILVD